MDIGQLLGSYCFPIVACIGMAFYVKYITDKNSKDISELNSNHTKEMLAYKDEIKDAITNNTKVMEKLCDKIEGLKNIQKSKKEVKSNETK